MMAYHESFISYYYKLSDRQPSKCTVYYFRFITTLLLYILDGDDDNDDDE